MSGIGQGTLPEFRKWSRDPPGGQWTLPEVRKWSGDPLRGPEVVGVPSRRSGSGRRDLPAGPEVVEGTYPQVW